MTDAFDLQTSDRGVTTLSTPFGANRLIFETGRLAKQANGSVIAQVGGTVVMANVVGATDAKEGQDFFPLTVDYREKAYSAGRIPGGYIKRENRPSNGETLKARLIDRPLRPLFPEGMFNEVQVYISVLSYDGQNPPELAGMNAASLALGISDIPFNGPLAGVRIGLVDDEFIANPTIEQLAMSDLDLVVAGTKSAILMVEAGANELPEDVLLEALEFAHENIIALCEAQAAMIAQIGKPKFAVGKVEHDAALLKKVKTTAKKYFAEVMKTTTKKDHYAAVAEAKKAVLEKLVDTTAADAAAQKTAVKAAFEKEWEIYLRESTLKGVRCDGRGPRDIRPITIELGVLPRTHGSAVFTRGETQVLGVCTLGTSEDEQMNEDINGISYQRFYLHYNFPAFSVGEVKPMRGPGRREIGHGALAERALMPMVPLKSSEFPYTVRVVGETLESHGSSSMATVCAGTLSMFDAGVRMKRPVAGIAMGLIIEGDQYVVLSDISGTEDHLGDMDFKVAGTSEGVTALQMDIKVEGITLEIMREALAQANEGRKHILGKILEACPGPRTDVSEFAPAIRTFQIDPAKIRDLIGPGGKTINSIQDETGARITVENDGTVTVASADRKILEEVLRRIELLTAEAQVGATYTGKVVNITNFGAFVEILPGRDGLLHISELEHFRVNRVEDVVKLGDEVTVKCVGVDPNGKVRLSRKALTEEPAGAAGAGAGKPARSEAPAGRGDRPDRGERGERPLRGERGERPARGERGERPARAERGDRPERPERAERGDQPERFERGAYRRGAEAPAASPAPAKPGRRDEDDDYIPPYRRGASNAELDEDEDDLPIDEEEDFEEFFDDEEDVDLEFNAPGNTRDERRGPRGGGAPGGGPGGPGAARRRRRPQRPGGGGGGGRRGGGNR